MPVKYLSGLILAMLLLGSSVGVLHGQNTPNPQPAPQAAPHPQPAPPEPPESPNPPEPPDPPQVFVLNDGAAHLGVTLGDVTTEKAQELKLPAVAGAIVTSVQKDSAAEKAGIETDDTIIEFDGERVRRSAQLRRMIRETPTGRTVAIKVIREGKTLSLSAELKSSPNEWHRAPQANDHMPEIRPPAEGFNMPNMLPPPEFYGLPSPPMAHRTILGISGQDLTPQLAQYFGVKQGKGVLIAEVTKGGPADKAGMKAGDVIVQVDSKSVGSVEELRATLRDDFTGDTRKVSLTIVRDHHEQTVSANLNRSQTWGNRTSTAPARSYDEALAQVHAQAGQLRALAESQRSLVQDEVLKQQQQMQGEWQRQLREQMRALRDQLKQFQKLHLAPDQDGEI